MSCGFGSSNWGFFCAARKRRFEGVASAASSARIDESRPTTKGAIMWGKTTMSRSGTSGSVSVCREALSEDFMGFFNSNPAAGISGSRPPGRGPGWPCRLSRLAQNRDGVRVVLDHVSGDDALLDVIVGRDLIHDIEHQILDDDLESPRADVARERFLGDRLDSVVGEAQMDVLELEHRLVLLDQRVLRLLQDLHERGLI